VERRKKKESLNNELVSLLEMRESCGVEWSGLGWSKNKTEEKTRQG